MGKRIAWVAPAWLVFVAWGCADPIEEPDPSEEVGDATAALVSHNAHWHQSEPPVVLGRDFDNAPLHACWTATTSSSCTQFLDSCWSNEECCTGLCDFDGR